MRLEGLGGGVERLGSQACANDADALRTSPCAMRITASVPFHHYIAEDAEVAIQVGAVAQRDANCEALVLGPPLAMLSANGVIVAQPRVDFIGESVAGALGAVRLGDAGLVDMAGDHSMVETEPS